MPNPKPTEEDARNCGIVTSGIWGGEDGLSMEFRKACEK